MARSRARSVIEDGPPKDDAKTADVNRCLVFCRVRPSFPRDFEDGAFPLLNLTGKRVAVKDERTYDYDGTFGGDSEQKDVFKTVALPCIQHAFKGFCSALMCYGQTGTGKSFTMCCTKPGQEGIIPQAAQVIFDTIRRDPARKYTVKAEFIQIYRDQLGDLMTGSGKDRVDIHWDQEEGVSLPGCSTHELATPEQFMEFYHEGDQRRVVMATAMNPESSRGHTALVVRITSVPLEDELSGTMNGKITFIDLAGYERFSKTGISNANPIMKDEAKTINASLLSLGHVVTALSNGDKHIPWRNSKLTRLLQDSIGGRSRTTIILTVGPSSDHLHESTNTLQFGMRAMAVKVTAKVSMTVDYEKLASKLQAMLEEKDARISDLEIQAAANDAERQELLERHRRDQEEMESQHAQEIDRALREGATPEQLLQMQRQLTVEASQLKEQQEEEAAYHDEKHQKDMLAVFSEEQKRSQRTIEQEKMARERAVEELQQRLDEARNGDDNKDLIKALQELAERDATLASRAQDIARLQQLCESLAEQVREAGGEPESLFDVDAATVVDMSQVDDLKQRYERELEATRNQVADLRKALEESSARASTRVEEAEEYKKQLRELKSQLASEAIDDMLASPTKMDSVDLGMPAPVDVEAIKAGLQSDIDFWRARATTLQEDLDAAKKQYQQQAAMSSSSAVGGTTPRTGRSAASANNTAAANVNRQQLQDLHMKVERLTTENALLQEKAIAAAGDGVASASTDATGTTDLKPSQAERLKAVLSAKDSQIEEAFTLVSQREKQLGDAKRQIHSLKTQLALDKSSRTPAGPEEPENLEASMVNLGGSIIAAEGVNFAQYMSAMNALRERNAELERMILGDVSADTAAALSERDETIADQESRLQSQAAELESLATAVARLERQLEDAGEVPVCRLDGDRRADIEAALAEEREELEERQRELEADLQRKASEKQKATALLQNLNEDRMKEAALFKQREAELQAKVKAAEEERARQEKAAERRLKELEDQRLKEEEEIAKLRAQIRDRDAARTEEEASAKAKEEADARKLKAELHENTRMMMEAQARLAQEREEQGDGGGLFSRLRRKLRD